MTLAVQAYEPTLRLGIFLGVFVLLALWEALAPRRAVRYPRTTRWPANFGIVAIDTALVRVLLPTAAVGAAVYAEARGWGLLRAIGAPFWFAVPVSVAALDLAIYLQHVAFHAVPSLWRLHRMHHADLHIDVTTGVRFHPMEILLSLLIKIAVVVALGAPALAVFTFEVLLNATSMFNHTNGRLPRGLDRLVRLVVVTPDMHRVHHSVERAETDSNFGFNFPWWDWLFGTYRAEPAAGHTDMTVGLQSFRDLRELRLDRMLLQPLRDDAPDALSFERERT